jgi:hypothetical protein
VGHDEAFERTIEVSGERGGERSVGYRVCLHRPMKHRAETIRCGAPRSRRFRAGHGPIDRCPDEAVGVP